MCVCVCLDDFHAFFVEPTVQRRLKQEVPHVRSASRRTDVCTVCRNYDTIVVPTTNTRPSGEKKNAIKRDRKCRGGAGVRFSSATVWTANSPRAVSYLRSKIVIFAVFSKVFSRFLLCYAWSWGNPQAHFPENCGFFRGCSCVALSPGAIPKLIFP